MLLPTDNEGTSNNRVVVLSVNADGTEKVLAGSLKTVEEATKKNKVSEVKLAYMGR